MRLEQYSRVKDFRKYIVLTFIFIATFSISIFGQSGGSTGSQKKTSSDKADQNLRSLARVNPSSLAMEMNVPFLAYPGRNGSSVPINLTYSSKVWQMDNIWSWTYREAGAPPPPTQNGAVDTYLRYMTDLNAAFAKYSNAGWNSTLTPPVLEERDHVFTSTGALYPFATTQDGLDDIYDFLFQDPGTSSTQLTRTYHPPAPDCGAMCGVWRGTGCDPVNWTMCENWSCLEWHFSPCYNPDDFPPNGPIGTQPGQLPQPNPIGHTYAIKRIFVRTTDGASHEFRRSDSIALFCNGSPNDPPECSGPLPDHLGTFLSIDSSGMRLVRTSQGSTLFLPDGSTYKFPASHQHVSEGAALFFATQSTDVNGNKIEYSEDIINNESFAKQTDTMGRVLTSPLSENFGQSVFASRTNEIRLPGLGETEQIYGMEWEPLKQLGCEDQTDSSCGDGTDPDSLGDGALEDQSQKLYYYSPFVCLSTSSTNLPTNEVLFPQTDDGLRTCNPTNFAATPAVPARFNPVVLSKVSLPNGKSYVFKYNRYGEISKIVYPNGSYESFTYAYVKPLSANYKLSYDQANRGVVERRVYDTNNVLQQRWRYSGEPTTGLSSTYKVTTIAPKGNDPLGDGVKTERSLYAGISAGTIFGLEDPKIGMAFEEKAFDENGTLRSRTLNEWIVKRPPIGGTELFNALRDPRLKRSVTINFEPGSDSALATMQESEFDETGSTDPQFFSHLNVKRKKAYHYALISDKTTVDNETLSWETIQTWFPASKLASISETDYSYNSTAAAYKDRGIVGLPVETRVLNPTNTSDVLAKTQPIYDEGGVYFIDEGSTTGYEVPTGANTHLRGNVTTSRTWVKETDTWLQTHTAYDNFGNVRKVWDATGDTNPSKFVETQYSADYSFAYPTKVISPAPDPDNTHGTSQTSSAETTYDPNTGLVLTAKDDFGQITKTEYNDLLLRPTKVFGDNFTAPITETIYDDNALTVKVRKQIDEVNWDEATTYSDSLGRAIKTVETDSQGDVIVETHYDLLGRVDRVSNPFRAGNAVYWNKTKYDEAGRAVESYAPASLTDITNNTNLVSLGTIAFGISGVTNYVGTFVIATDASGRKSRSITNALDQLLRVDEPTATGGTADADLGAIGSPAQPTYYTYDLYGNMVKVAQGGNGQKRYFKYDSLGRLIRVNQPEQEVNPNLQTTDNPDNNSWTAGFTYDALGNVLTATDAKGTTVTNTYDRAGRVKVRSYSDSTPAVYFYYDGKGLAPGTPIGFAKGNLTVVESAISRTDYKLFDNFGRLKEMEQRTPVDHTIEVPGNTAPKTSKYTYNLSGALVEEEYPSGRKVKNEYEADGDLKRIYGKANSTAAEQTYANSFSYTVDGKIQKLRLGNGLWESAKFNNRMQPTEIAMGHSAGDGNLWKLTYEYGELATIDGTVNTDKNTGNIARQTVSFAGLSNPFVQSYKYDALYRLTEARETKNSYSNQTWKQTFGYDVYGNRNAFTQDVGGNQTSGTPAVNAATNRFTSTNFTYDKNGNITADIDPLTSTARQFVFNGDNKQVEVNAGSTNIGKYYYDGEGKRIKKVTPIETTVFVYSAGKLAEEYSTATPPSTPTINYTATDLLGSPRVLTDKWGNVTSRRDFMPFGEEIYADGTNRTTAGKYSVTGEDSVRKRFTGYEKDKETSLDFAEARYYNNFHGRFTAVDPLFASGKSASPQTFNRYIYVINNPLIFTDPSGLQAGAPIGVSGILGNAGQTSRAVADGATRTFNYIMWGVFGTDADVEKEVNARKERLIMTAAAMGNKDGSLMIQALDQETIIRFTPDQIANLNRAQVWMLSSMVFGNEGNRQTLSKEDIAGKVVDFAGQITSGGRPALRGDEYHPDAVRDRTRPPYRSNPAHDPRSSNFNPRKTPEPSDAAAVYRNSVRGGMGTWYGKGADGKFYQFYSDNAGGVHFSGIIPRDKVPVVIQRVLDGR